MISTISSWNQNSISANNASDQYEKEVLLEQVLKNIDSLPTNAPPSDGANLLRSVIFHFTYASNPRLSPDDHLQVIQQLVQKLPQEAFWQQDIYGLVPLTVAFSAPDEVFKAIFNAMDLKDEENRSSLLKPLPEGTRAHYLVEHILKTGPVNAGARGLALMTAAERRDYELTALFLSDTNNAILEENLESAFFKALKFDPLNKKVPDLKLANLIAPPGKMIPNDLCTRLLNHFAENDCFIEKLRPEILKDDSLVGFILEKCEALSDIDLTEPLNGFVKAGNLKVIERLKPFCKTVLPAVSIALKTGQTDVAKYLLKTCPEEVTDHLNCLHRHSLALDSIQHNPFMPTPYDPMENLELIQLLTPPGLKVRQDLLEKEITKAIEKNAPAIVAYLLDGHGDVSEELLKRVSEFLKERGLTL